MTYIVVVNNPVYEDDFVPIYRFFPTLEEAKAYKKSIDDEGDYFTIVDIYEAKRIM